MNKLLIACGLVMLGTTTTPQENTMTTNCSTSEDSIHVNMVETNSHEILALESKTMWRAPKLVSRVVEHNPKEIKVSDIAYLEEDNAFELGFNTAEYLPEDFDPYTTYFDINSVIYIDDEITELGFETAAFLPTGFDAYADPTNIDGINYMEDDVVDLGFDTEAYLPEGFDPYEFYFDLDSVEYIEEEEELDFDFNTEDYLPIGFNPL